MPERDVAGAIGELRAWLVASEGPLADLDCLTDEIAALRGRVKPETHALAGRLAEGYLARAEQAEARIATLEHDLNTSLYRLNAIGEALGKEHWSGGAAGWSLDDVVQAIQRGRA